jgi:ribosomal-protein-alanine N-acetyltransferase
VLADDISAIAAIERACFPKPWSHDDFEAELRRQRSIFRLLEVHGEIAGYYVVYAVLDESELANIAVSPFMRGCGYGRELLKHAVKSASAAKVMFLEVGVDNEAALRLYREAGFEEVGYIKDYYGKGSDAYIMKLNICDEVRDDVEK